MYLGSQVDVYTRMQNLTSERKARAIAIEIKCSARGQLVLQRV